MKKIRNLQELQAEKNKLQQEQKDLENKMQENWSDLKESVRPVNIAKDTINSLFNRSIAGNYSSENFIKKALVFGVGLLAKKFVRKMKEKLVNVFK